MRVGRSFFALFICVSLGVALAPARADDARFGPGTKLDTFTVGTTTYRNVQIRSVNARTVTITHAGGMTSIHLRDLAPEWQARFRYDPAADAAAERILDAPVIAPPRRPVPPPAESVFARLLRQFGEPAAVRPEVDLRPKFFQLELGVKNQGRRPSCAIFAIVSALEFQSAELTGRPQPFSEEYLSWATRKLARRIPPAAPSTGESAAANDDADDGFSLGEVVNALRGYGIPPESAMPNTFGRAIATIGDPPPAVIAEARRHQKVFIHLIPGRDNATRINNTILALNAGVPVVIGLGWPNYRSLRSGYLGGQKPIPGYGHAVTLVGYLAKDGRPGDAVFIFKNSWGVDWGQGGYGTVSYRYLDHNLGDAVLLEVQRG